MRRPLRRPRPQPASSPRSCMNLCLHPFAERQAPKEPSWGRGGKLYAWGSEARRVPQRKKSGRGWGPRTCHEQMPSGPERGAPAAPESIGSLPPSLSPFAVTGRHTCPARGERVGGKRGGRCGAGSLTSRLCGTLGEESAAVGCNEAPAVGDGAAVPPEGKESSA